MDEKSLIKQLADTVEKVPSNAEVLALRQYSLQDIEKRAKRFLGFAGEVCHVSPNRGDWLVQPERTLVRLPLGARAIIIHASGALKLLTGLNPMESLFKKMEDRQKLTSMVEETASRLKLTNWIGAKEALKFEHLWQIKAAAADPKGKGIPPVLCRAIGAYRHSVQGLRVWGAASVAVSIAGDGKLDSLQIQLREPTGEVVNSVKVLRPDYAARQILLQMSRLMGRSRVPFTELAAPQWMRFGYLSLSKRKTQRVLAPVYVAAIETKSPQETQAYVFAVSASEQSYLPLCLNGSEVMPGPARTAHCACA
jgi:hypothetical protein